MLIQILKCAQKYWLIVAFALVASGCTWLGWSLHTTRCEQVQAKTLTLYKDRVIAVVKADDITQKLADARRQGYAQALKESDNVKSLKIPEVCVDPTPLRVLVIGMQHDDTGSIP